MGIMAVDDRRQRRKAAVGERTIYCRASSWSSGSTEPSVC